MLAEKLQHAAGSTLYVDDVFSAYTYTGNGGTQSIVNGINLSTYGGMVWTKDRTYAYNNVINDTARGASQALITNDTSANTYLSTDFTSFNSNGYTLGSALQNWQNQNNEKYIGWTFRKATKFFDVVTFTTDGAGAATINHSLGITPGLVITKSTGTSGNWWTFHRSLTNQYLTLNSTNAAAATPVGAWTDTQITFATGQLNASVNVVAYIFAHDTRSDGIIQCGSFTTDGSGNATVNLGWEPQFVMQKKSSTTGNWQIVDSSRGNAVHNGTTNNEELLYPNTAGAAVMSYGEASPTATGFEVSAYPVGVTLIYLAIRRPNKPPTLGTQVYNAIARTGTGAAATVTGVGFAPDLVIPKDKASVSNTGWFDRLRGTPYLYANGTAAEGATANSITSYDMNGMTLGTDAATGFVNTVSRNYINWFFKRAPGVFDVVCWTTVQNSAAVTTITHNLGVAPQLIICKSRNTANGWLVYSGSGNNKVLHLETTAADTTTGWTQWGTPTSATFGVDEYNSFGYANTTVVAYLFATLAGVSKCGNYTGNGSSQTINCGFGTGARFILIKRTDSTGDWFVYDSTRTYPAGNDPHLSLNTTAAEVTTTDDVDYEASGFIVNQNATTNLNVTSATYLYLSFS